MSQKSDCVENLIAVAKEKGYLTFDDIMDASDEYELDLSEIDTISEELSMRHILIYEEEPGRRNDNDIVEYEDFSQINYDRIYEEIISIAPSLKTLIEEIKAIPPPQYGEVTRLIRQLSDDNKYVKKRLAESHLRVAVKTALNMSKRYRYDLEDAISASFVGLIEGVEHYQQNSFSAFQSYVSFWIRQKINRYCRPDWVEYYYPAHMMEKIISISEMIDEHGECEFCEENGCKLLTAIVAYKLKLDEQYVDQLIRSIRFQKEKPYSITTIEKEILAHRIKEKEFHEYPEQLVSEQHAENEVIQKDCEQLIRRLMADLKERERIVINLRFGFGNRNPMSLEEVGKRLGITRERVRQIEAKALRKLRNPIRSKRIRDFSD